VLRTLSMYQIKYISNISENGKYYEVKAR
jgi:hypothetical protein